MVYVAFILVLVLSAMLVVAYYRLRATRQRIQEIEQSRKEVVGRESTLRTAITDAKEIEQRLAQERDALKALMDNIPDQIYFKDAQGRFSRVNLSVARVLGIASPEDAVGKTDADYFTAEEARAFRTDDQTVISSGRPLVDRTEKAIVHGKEIWMSTTKVPLVDAEGKPAGLVGISRDITDRKVMEAEIAKERDLLEALMENIPDNIYFKDAQARFIKVNRHQAQSCGLKDGREAHGKTDFDFYPAQLAAEFNKDDMELLRTGKPVIGKIEQQFLQGGPECWTLTSKVPFRDRNGKIIGIVGVSKDITAIKMLERQLADANIQLSKLAREDSLTGLLNRRMILELVENEWARWKRYQKPFSIMVIDADNFKSINDCWGHLVGDQALKLISSRMSVSVRSVDIVGRYGGEEFIIILPETEEGGALSAAEKILVSIRGEALNLEGTQLRMTVSIGVAEVSEGDKNASALIERADNALLEAKHRGKNRAVAADASVLEGGEGSVIGE